MELFSLPKARTAVTAKLAGFIDLLMLVILGSSIESELTRFVITEAVVKGIILKWSNWSGHPDKPHNRGDGGNVSALT